MGDSEFVFRGSLADTPLPVMLATIHRYRVPGVMELRRDGIVKRVFISDGDIIFATSSERGESLGDTLLADGVITPAQYKVSSDELRRSPGKRHGSVLVELGFISAEQLGPAVRGQVQRVVWSIFDWDEGEVSFSVGSHRDDEVFKIKIPTPRAILTGCRKIEDGRRVISYLGGKGTVYRPLPVPAHLAGLRLDSGEQELLEQIDGKKSLYDLCETGPFAAGTAARVLFAFNALQLIEQVASPHSRIKVQLRQSGEPS